MDALALPLQSRLVLLTGPRAARPQLLVLAARLALAGPLRVLDGGNSFDAYAVARSLRGHTARVEPLLGRIQVQRAFTCYQLLALLNETPPAAQPTLVLDALSTFHDESVYLAERRRLLGECGLRLRFLSRSGPVLVGVRPPERLPGSAGLYALLQAACDVSLHLHAEEPPPPPPSLPGFG